MCHDGRGGLEDIKRWLEENFTTEEEFRELPEEIELAPGVKIKVPRPTLPKSMTKKCEADSEG